MGYTLPRKTSDESCRVFFICASEDMPGVGVGQWHNPLFLADARVFPMRAAARASVLAWIRCATGSMHITEVCAREPIPDDVFHVKHGRVDRCRQLGI